MVKSTHIFIIPYRHREEELAEWIANMIPYLNIHIGYGKYEVIVVNQGNEALFNRGALCNIGYLEIKKKYPNNYKHLQYIFHDVDVYPLKKDIINYNTMLGEAKHPYGELLTDLGGTLGTICVMIGSDYEKVNGHPNYYGWGSEDVCIARRCNVVGIRINNDNMHERWRCDDIIKDIPSHTTEHKRRFIRATNKMNFKLMINENHSNPSNGLSSINYSVSDIKSISNNHGCYTIITVNF